MTQEQEKLLQYLHQNTASKEFITSLLAGKENLPSEIINYLAQSQDSDIRIRVAARADINEKTIIKLLYDPTPNVSLSILNNLKIKINSNILLKYLDTLLDENNNLSADSTALEKIARLSHRLWLNQKLLSRLINFWSSTPELISQAPWQALVIGSYPNSKNIDKILLSDCNNFEILYLIARKRYLNDYQANKLIHLAQNPPRNTANNFFILAENFLQKKYPSNIMLNLAKWGIDLLTPYPQSASLIDNTLQNIISNSEIEAKDIVKLYYYAQSQKVQLQAFENVLLIPKLHDILKNHNVDFLNLNYHIKNQDSIKIIVSLLKQQHKSKKYPPNAESLIL
jgi:hypothetical protein